MLEQILLEETIITVEIRGFMYSGKAGGAIEEVH